MAIILEGSGTVTGITTFTTPLDDIKFDSIEVTGIATAATFQVGTGVSIGNPRLQNLSLYTNDTEFVTVDNVGNVGFGTTNAQIAAQASNAKVINAGIVTANQYFGNQLTAAGVRVTGVSTFAAVTATTGTFSGAVSGTTGTFTGDISIADKIVHTGDTNTAIRFPSADTFSVETGGSERSRVTSTGNLLVGATAVEDWDGSRDHRIQVRGNTYQTAGISILDTQNDDNSGELVIGKSRGTGNTIVGSADDIGQIRFAANDGAGFHSIAWVRASMDGTPGSDDLPSNLRFGTSADGGATVSERLRIDSSGRLLLGTTTEGNANADNLTIADSGTCGISIRSGTSNTGNVYFSDATSGSGEFAGAVEYSHSTNSLQLHTNGSERLRISSTGAVGTAATVRCAVGGLDVAAQGATDLGTLTLGASGGQNGQNRTSSVENQFRIMTPSYADPAKMFTVIYGASGSSMHEINYGGGTGWAYAANQHRFFTAANATTGTGTERVRISADGSWSKFIDGSATQVAFPGSGQVNGITATPSGVGNPIVVGRDTGTLRSGHFAGHLKFTSGYGIDFGDTGGPDTGATGSSEILDDYEEGSWSGLVMDGNSSNITINNVVAKYVKVGQLVYCYFNITRNDTGKTGNISFYQLPYTAANSTLQITGTWWLDEGGVANGDSVGGAIYVIQNTNNASFVHPTSNAQQTANRYLQFSEWSQHRPIYGSFTYQTPE